MEMESEKATVNQIKEFFSCKDTARFIHDWKQLSKEDQKFFKTEIGKVINA